MPPRLNRLVFGSRTIETPHFLANTSRGVVPHLTPDNLDRAGTVQGVYISIEDFLERDLQSSPILTSSTQGRPLKDFIALSDQPILVLGARRSPPLVAPPATSNTDSAVAISTSTGFRFLEALDYAKHVDNLAADIVVSLADIPYGRAKSSKRIEKAIDRSIEWFRHLQATRVYASLLPVSCAHQQDYVQSIQGVEGLAIYSLDTLEDLPEHFSRLPKLGLTEPKTPLDVLHHIQHGIDMLVMPFIDVATDAGLAFHFGLSKGSEMPLAVDMWDPAHATDLSPLMQGCKCYACTNHHRAYVQHLLSAKEMLGWTLIQFHNYAVIDRFFAEIRQAIAESNFVERMEAFAQAYEPDFPNKTGQGPRVRGYQRRSEGPNEPKRNRAAFRRLEDPRDIAARARTVAKISGLTDDLDMMIGLD